jgi:hypothetical protein
MCKFFYFDTCEQIDLSSQELEDDDIRPLCANLGRFKMLKMIDLSDNKLSDSGGRLIAEGLKSNCSVTIVRLKCSNFSGVENGISTILKREITQSIQEGRGNLEGVAVACRFFCFDLCEEMDLSNELLEDNCIFGLCSNLGRFKMLKAIDLRGNKLSDLGGRFIAEGLKSNCSVTELHLQVVDFDSYDFQHSSDSSNNIGDAVMQEITSLVQRNCDEPDQRHAEVSAINESYFNMMSSAPTTDDFDCSGLRDGSQLCEVIAHVASHYSATTASIRSIIFSRPFLSLKNAVELQHHLLSFSSLKHVSISGNPYLGTAGVAAITASLTGGINSIETSDCGLGLDWYLPVPVIARLRSLQKLLCINQNETKHSKLCLPARVCIRGIDSIIFSTQSKNTSKVLQFRSQVCSIALIRCKLQCPIECQRISRFLTTHWQRHNELPVYDSAYCS